MPTKSSDDLAEDVEPQQPAASDLAEPTDTQEQESENNSAPPHPPETDDATEQVEGSSEQATATGQEEGGEEPATTEDKPGDDIGETEMLTEDKSAEDNSTDNQPAGNAESSAPAVEEKSDHEDKVDLDNTNGKPMPTGADEQDMSGETAEPNRDGEITEMQGEVKDKTQQESLINDNEIKGSGNEVQATIETSSNN